MISKPNVDALLPIMAENLARLPESVLVILYCLDNSCFKALNKNGDLVSFSHSKKDQLYHVMGDLMAVNASKKLLQDMETLNQQLANRLNRRNTQFLFTGDLVSGKNTVGWGTWWTAYMSAGEATQCTATRAPT
jgi:hypothetical protein